MIPDARAVGRKDAKTFLSKKQDHSERRKRRNEYIGRQWEAYAEEATTTNILHINR